jgi:predicted permease
MMMELFTETFTTMLGAVGRIFIIIVAAGFLLRKNIITNDHVKALSKVTVNILLPCMLFSKISNNFDAEIISWWWAIPLASSVMVAVGVGFGYLFYLRKYKEKQFLIPIGSMQNAVYLVLPIGMFMYAEQFDLFAIYNFLFLIGYIPLLWSVGKILITGGSFKTVKRNEILTTPFVSVVVTMVIVLLGLHQFVPPMLMDSIDLVGNATIPVSNIVLGATLGGISFKVLPQLSDVLKLSLIKYILIPLSVIGLLYAIGLKETNPLLANLLVIESTAAPATALILQVRAYGGDRQTIGSIMIISYAICLLAIPFWVAVWQVL